MQRIQVLNLCWLFLVTQYASAGPLYGTVQQAGAPAGGVTIIVTCPAMSGAVEAATDARGSYSMRVPASGRCEMRVRRDALLGAAFEVFISDNPLRFDLQIDGAMNRVP